MDRKNDSKIAYCGNGPDLAGRRLAVGAKQLKKAVAAGTAQEVFLAEDADPAVTGPLEQLCQTQHVRISWVPTMAALGRACGIEVGAAAAAALGEKLGSIG